MRSAGELDSSNSTPEVSPTSTTIGSVHLDRARAAASVVPHPARGEVAGESVWELDLGVLVFWLELPNGPPGSIVVTALPGHSPEASTSAIVSRVMCSCSGFTGKIRRPVAGAGVVLLMVEVWTGRGDLEEETRGCRDMTFWRGRRRLPPRRDRGGGDRWRGRSCRRCIRRGCRARRAGGGSGPPCPKTATREDGGLGARGLGHVPVSVRPLVMMRAPRCRCWWCCRWCRTGSGTRRTPARRARRRRRSAAKPNSCSISGLRPGVARP